MIIGEFKISILIHKTFEVEQSCERNYNIDSIFLLNEMKNWINLHKYEYISHQILKNDTKDVYINIQLSVLARDNNHE